MTADHPHHSARRLGRTIGVLYLVNVIAGIFSLMVVPAQTSGHGDPVAAARNILAHESLFRAGIVVALLCYVEFLLVPLALYRLLGAAHRSAAMLMVALAAISIPLSIAPLAHQLDALTLLGNAGYLHVYDAAQLHAQLMLQLNAYGNGLLMAQIFWGLWLLPFGYLVWVSRQLPRLLGALLILGGLGYVADFLGQIMLPGYSDLAIANYLTMPAGLGEIGTCLWLLIMGARPLAPARIGEAATQASRA